MFPKIGEEITETWDNYHYCYDVVQFNGISITAQTSMCLPRSVALVGPSSNKYSSRHKACAVYFLRSSQIYSSRRAESTSCLSIIKHMITPLARLQFISVIWERPCLKARSPLIVSAFGNLRSVSHRDLIVPFHLDVSACE